MLIEEVKEEIMTELERGIDLLVEQRKKRRETMKMIQMMTPIFPKNQGQVVESTENVILDDEHHERTTQIGSSLDASIKQELITFLRNRKKTFAWSHEDMPGIDPNFLCHEINVNKEIKPIK